MKYFIKRDLSEYGPYTLADLQRYVAQGNILMSDLARSEGLTDWVPVSQVLGNIPVPVPAAQGTVYAGTPAAGTVYGATPGYGVAAAPAAASPVPPDLHWALVLLISFFCGIFHTVWLFVEAAYVKKIRPQSNFLGFLIAGLAVPFGGLLVFWGFAIASAARSGDALPPMAGFELLMVLLAGAVLFLVGIFKMRDALEDYYNTTENIGLRLSGVMTFFFSVYYFQYHFSRIAQWKKTGILQPQ